MHSFEVTVHSKNSFFPPFLNMERKENGEEEAFAKHLLLS